MRLTHFHVRTHVLHHLFVSIKKLYCHLVICFVLGLGGREGGREREREGGREREREGGREGGREER